MMSTRIKSAAVAIVIAVIALILHGTFVFNLVIGFISALAIFEIFKAVGLGRYKAQAICCYVFAAVDALMPYFYSKGWLYFISYRLYLGLFMTAMCILYLKEHKKFRYDAFFSMAGVTLLITYSMGVIIKMAQDKSTVLMMPDAKRGGAQIFLMVLTLAAAWLADSGAYFVGTFFSRSGREVHHPWPEISPKKTIEGLVGGVITNGVLMLVISFIYDLMNEHVTMHYFIIFIAGMLCALIGLLGDLTASMIKRQTGIKDFGNIMPGHGGVMDRFDSVLLVAPFMFYLISQGLIFK